MLKKIKLYFAFLFILFQLLPVQNLFARNVWRRNSVSNNEIPKNNTVQQNEIIQNKIVQQNETMQNKDLQNNKTNIIDNKQQDKKDINEKKTITQLREDAAKKLDSDNVFIDSNKKLGFIFKDLEINFSKDNLENIERLEHVMKDGLFTNEMLNKKINFVSFMKFNKETNKLEHCLVDKSYKGKFVEKKAVACYDTKVNFVDNSKSERKEFIKQRFEKFNSIYNKDNFIKIFVKKVGEPYEIIKKNDKIINELEKNNFLVYFSSDIQQKFEKVGATIGLIHVFDKETGEFYDLRVVLGVIEPKVYESFTNDDDRKEFIRKNYIFKKKVAFEKGFKNYMSSYIPKIIELPKYLEKKNIKTNIVNNKQQDNVNNKQQDNVKEQDKIEMMAAQKREDALKKLDSDNVFIGSNKKLGFLFKDLEVNFSKDNLENIEKLNYVLNIIFYTKEFSQKKMNYFTFMKFNKETNKLEHCLVDKSYKGKFVDKKATACLDIDVNFVDNLKDERKEIIKQRFKKFNSIYNKSNFIKIFVKKVGEPYEIIKSNDKIINELKENNFLVYFSSNIQQKFEKVGATIGLIHVFDKETGEFYDLRVILGVIEPKVYESFTNDDDRKEFIRKNYIFKKKVAFEKGFKNYMSSYIPKIIELPKYLEKKNIKTNIVNNKQQDKVKQNKARQNVTIQNKARQNVTIQSKARQNKVRQNKARQNVTIQNKARQNKARQNAIIQNKARQNAIIQNKARQNVTIQSKARQNKVRQNKARQNATIQNKARQNKARQNATIQNKARQDVTIQSKVRKNKARQNVTIQNKVRQNVTIQNKDLQNNKTNIIDNKQQDKKDINEKKTITQLREDAAKKLDSDNIFMNSNKKLGFIFKDLEVDFSKDNLENIERLEHVMTTGLFTDEMLNKKINFVSFMKFNKETNKLEHCLVDLGFKGKFIEKKSVACYDTKVNFVDNSKSERKEFIKQRFEKFNSIYNKDNFIKIFVKKVGEPYQIIKKNDKIIKELKKNNFLVYFSSDIQQKFEKVGATIGLIHVFDKETGEFYDLRVVLGVIESKVYESFTNDDDRKEFIRKNYIFKKKVAFEKGFKNYMSSYIPKIIELPKYLEKKNIKTNIVNNKQQDKVKQNKARQNVTIQNKARQNKARQNVTIQNKARQVVKELKRKENVILKKEVPKIVRKENVILKKEVPKIVRKENIISKKEVSKIVRKEEEKKSNIINKEPKVAKKEKKIKSNIKNKFKKNRKKVNKKNNIKKSVNDKKNKMLNSLFVSIIFIIVFYYLFKKNKKQ